MVAPLYAIGVQLKCLLPTLAPKHHREGRYYSCDVGCAVPGQEQALPETAGNSRVSTLV